jgi:HipA-like protein
MNNLVDKDIPGLDVYLQEQKVGRLWLDEKRRFVFQYDGAWVRQQGAVPLSVCLPLQAAPYPDDSARPFFSNLLPEADIKRIIHRIANFSYDRSREELSLSPPSEPCVRFSRTRGRGLKRCLRIRRRHEPLPYPTQEQNQGFERSKLLLDMMRKIGQKNIFE